MADQKVQELLADVKKNYSASNPDLTQIKKTLSQIKILLTQFQLIPPFKADEATVKKHLLLARETLELATYVSVSAGDEEAFERHVNQVKPYYQDYSAILPASERQWPITGLYLLFLLARNRIADFHSEMELIPTDRRENCMFIKCCVSLESWLMEGGYNKVFAAKNDMPLPLYDHFMTKLLTTVREKIADCAEKAYETFPLSQAASLLMLDKAQVTAFCEERGWVVGKDDMICFKSFREDNTKEQLPSLSLTAQLLQYASELERIV